MSQARRHSTVALSERADIQHPTRRNLDRCRYLFAATVLHRHTEKSRGGRDLSRDNHCQSGAESHTQRCQLHLQGAEHMIQSILLLLFAAGHSTPLAEPPANSACALITTAELE